MRILAKESLNLRMTASSSTFSVIDAMIACGLDNITRYISNTPVQRLPDGLINNYFQSCSDKSKKKFLDD